MVSTDNPINIAYSNMALELHQDLPYYESPPGVQLLHCLKFSPSVTGASPITLFILYMYIHMYCQLAPALRFCLLATLFVITKPHLLL